MIAVLYSDVLNRAAETAGRTRDKLPVSEALMLQGFLAVELQKLWNQALWPELLPDPLAVGVSGNRQFSKNEGNGGAGLVTTLAATASSADGFTATLACPNSYTAGQKLVNAVITGSEVPIFNGTFTLTVVSPTTMTYPLVQGGIIPAPPFAEVSIMTVVIAPELGDILNVTSKDPTQTTIYRGVDFEEANGYVRIYELLAQVWVEFVLPRPDLALLSGNALNNYPIPGRFSSILASKAGGRLLTSDGMLSAAGAQFALAKDALDEELSRVRPADRRVRPRVTYANHMPFNGPTTRTP